MSLIKKSQLVFLIIASTLGHSHSQTMKYLALGDSYTIGESVAFENNWPSQLKDSIENVFDKKVDLKIIAKTGWRTDELLKALSESNSSKDFDLVTILIGVNNQYQGRNFTQYEEELNAIIDQAIVHCKEGVSGVFIISIPDYFFTPFGLKSERGKLISKEIEIYNSFAEELALKRNIPFIDITKTSMNREPRMVAADGLHPSEYQYKAWVKLIMKELSKTDLSY